MRYDLETGNSGFGNYDLETKTRDLETIYKKFGIVIRSLGIVTLLGGEVLKMTWNRDKKSWRGETVKLRILLHVKV